MIRKTLTTLIGRRRAREQRTRLRAFPELRLCSSAEEMEKIRLGAWRRLTRNWRFWITTLGTIFLCLGGAKIVIVLGMPPNTVSEAFLLASGVVVLLFVIPLGLAYILIPRMVKRYVREEMSSSGIPICVKCGYDLRASKERCPECGTIFDEKLLKKNT